MVIYTMSKSERRTRPESPAEPATPPLPGEEAGVEQCGNISRKVKAYAILFFVIFFSLSAAVFATCACFAKISASSAIPA